MSTLAFVGIIFLKKVTSLYANVFFLGVHVINNNMPTRIQVLDLTWVLVFFLDLF
jgi:hypothetical protein